MHYLNLMYIIYINFLHDNFLLKLIVQINAYKYKLLNLMDLDTSRQIERKYSFYSQSMTLQICIEMNIYNP